MDTSGATGTGKTNVTPKTPSDICFAGTPLSVALAILKCLATQSSERGRKRDGSRLKAESLSFQTTPGSALEALTISRYGVFTTMAKESAENHPMSHSFKHHLISNDSGMCHLYVFHEFQKSSKFDEAVSRDGESLQS